METIHAKAKDEGIERGSKKASGRSLRNRAWLDIALIRNRGGLVGPSRRNQYVQRDNRDCDPLKGRLIGSHRFRSHNEAR